MMKTLSKKPLAIRDEIHGDIAFSQLPRLVIDHEYFQRLRHINQLGLADYVFPCASHTRFQHSLGTAFLAGSYFRSLIKGWLLSNFRYDPSYKGTKILIQKTIECVHDVYRHPPSHDFWEQVSILAGMLHDVGHGPWSHTFEIFMLNQDFSSITQKITGSVGAYYKDLESNKQTLQHEDISVLYTFQILKDFEDRGLAKDSMKFFVPVATLINRKMALGKFKNRFTEELDAICLEHEIKGGSDFHCLLGPLISGSFDVDRIDYIQRDGRNCGVYIGGIEWRRIVNKLLPCLAKHPNKKNEPKDVVLISSVKNQHVLDDFIFSLFQMYTQVYMHPKIVGLEESIRNALREHSLHHETPPITFDLHSSLTDEKFRVWLNVDLGATEIENFLLRRRGATFWVTASPTDESMEKDLKANGYSLIEKLDRPMMKDSVGVFLFSTFKNQPPDKLQLLPWSEVSPVSKEFHAINYSPKIWIRPEK